SNLPAGGGYTVSTTYGPASATSSSQTVTSGSTTNVNLTINTGTLKVTVKNQSAIVLQGVAVTLNGSGGFTASGTTNSSGVVQFNTVPAGGGYTATATYGAGSATASGQTVSSGSTT